MRGEGKLKPKELTGTPGGIRTPDLLLRRQPLYPSELQALIVGSIAHDRDLVNMSIENMSTENRY